MRLNEDTYQWFRDYAKRHGKPMSEILKEHLDELQHQDKTARHKPQQEKEL